ncbi:MAG: DMT family transporter, partial [Alphaproteobacteria bacterium]|nr:DMT family transporter [Alphaproteobacteria bacterium]
MTGQSAIRLLILSSLWGGSFLFMRMVTPILGPAFTVEGRVGFAAIFLFGLAILLKKNWNIFNHWQHYAILGFFNSALPFFMLSFATLTLSVSQTAILNATSPVWAFIIGVFLGHEKLTLKRGLGLMI